MLFCLLIIWVYMVANPLPVQQAVRQLLLIGVLRMPLPLLKIRDSVEVAGPFHRQVPWREHGPLPRDNSSVFLNKNWLIVLPEYRTEVTDVMVDKWTARLSMQLQTVCVPMHLTLTLQELRKHLAHAIHAVQ